jgi:hypothetical protein
MTPKPTLPGTGFNQWEKSTSAKPNNPLNPKRWLGKHMGTEANCNQEQQHGETAIKIKLFKDCYGNRGSAFVAVTFD